MSKAGEDSAAVVAAKKKKAQEMAAAEKEKRSLPAKDILPEETAKEFKIVNWKKGRSPRIKVAGFPEVNLLRLSVKHASRLVEAEFPYLERIETKTTSKKSDKTS